MPRRSRRAPAPVPDEAAVFGANVRRAREKAGLSQREFSDLSGITLSKLPAIENGRTDLRLSTMVRIAESLGLSLNRLLTQRKLVLPITSSPKP